MDLPSVIMLILGVGYVYCYPFNEGDIRLVGGSSDSEGTVLIFHDNLWGAICDYNWDIRDANVVCRQLGYPRALQYIQGSRFGRGRRRVWLVDVYCRGGETSLSECYHPGWGRLFRRHHSECRGHKHSAGVVCLNIETTTPSTVATTTTDYNFLDIAEIQNNDVGEFSIPLDPSDVLLGDEANNIPLRHRSEFLEPDLEHIPSTTRKTTTTPTTTFTTPTKTTPTTTTTTPTTTTTTPTTTTTTPTTTTTTPTTTTTTPTTPTTTTKKPTTKPTTQRSPTTVFDIAANLPELKLNQWVMDKDIERWVLVLRNDKYLVAVPGGSPKTMIKEEYINLRRHIIKPPTTTSSSYVFISNAVSDETNEEKASERMKADDPLVQSTGVDLVETNESVDSSADIRIKQDNDKKDDVDKDVSDMLKEKIEEDDLANNSFKVEQVSTVSKPPPTTSQIPTTTAPRPTTERQTTTAPRPTTTERPTTTPTPTSTTQTTIKALTTTITTTTTTTTTTTVKPTPQSRTTRQTTAYDRAANLPSFTLNTWVLDNDVVMWVLKITDDTFMVSKPGETPKQVTKDEFIRIRRQILQSSATTTMPTRQSNRLSGSHDEMKADDPGTANRISLVNDGLQLANIVEGGSRTLTPSNGQNERELSRSSSQTNLESNRAVDNTAHERIHEERIDSNSINTEINIDNTRHQPRHGSTDDAHAHRHRHGNTHDYQQNKRVQIRLSGGRSNMDGRIEVLPPDQSDWGVICGDTWSIREGIVACRHFGLGYAQQAAKTSYYGGKYQKKYYSAVKCKGTEKTLDECQWEDHNGLIQCLRSEAVAAIICSKSLPDLEPSTYMVETTSFLQDRHMYYLQCAMEENCLAPSAYELQKTSRNWRTSTRRLLRFSSVVKNKGTADFRPESRRSDWEWHACHMHYHSMEVFAHYDITDTNGNRVAEGLKASFCLEDSACDRGVFPKYECQNYGEQGISVGCSDNYMADIDCQWIDITDLKPGNYHFKLEVNPSLKVPEISYDNNGMSCKLQYTGYYARITECKLKSIL